MGQVSVTVAGRAYRMACADGEEGHLEGLARDLDEKITALRASFGEIGEMRLHVMAAITYADEMAEMRKRLTALEAEVVRLKGAGSAQDDVLLDTAERLAAAIDEAGARIEHVARNLARPLKE